MRITLIHNPGAGAGTSSIEAIERAIRAAGHDVLSVSSDAAGCASALREPADIVAVSGGDGTVGRIAKQMIGSGVPIAVLAAGTANNIALALGLDALPVEQQISRWPHAGRFAFDVLIATGPWGSEPLIEGLGVGLFASAMRRDRDAPRDEEAQPSERLARSLQMLKERAGAFETTHVHASLDGRDISGDYVLFEVMNTPFVGPNLFLASSARAGDGALDAVFVTNEERARLADHLASWHRGALRSSPALASASGRVLTMTWTGFDLHLDDRVWPDKTVNRSDRADAPIEVRVEPGAVEFLIP